MKMRRAMKLRNAGVASLMLAVILAVAPALAQQKNPERNIYYGETHVHTSWSFDAFAFGDSVTGPETGGGRNPGSCFDCRSKSSDEWHNDMEIGRVWISRLEFQVAVGDRW